MVFICPELKFVSNSILKKVSCVLYENNAVMVRKYAPKTEAYIQNIRDIITDDHRDKSN